jgi:hypothetical protein
MGLLLEDDSGEAKHCVIPILRLGSFIGDSLMRCLTSRVHIAVK